MKRKYVPARPVPVAVPEPIPPMPQDLVVDERRTFIAHVSPFHAHEKTPRYLVDYCKAWVLALMFNVPMPHERKFK